MSQRQRDRLLGALLVGGFVAAQPIVTSMRLVELAGIGTVGTNDHVSCS
jgi:hypothetical protein